MAFVPVPEPMFWRDVWRELKRPPSLLSSVIFPPTVDWSASTNCIGREAICSARLMEACRSEAKLLLPVVTFWGAVRAARLDAMELGLALIELPPSRSLAGPWSPYHRPSRSETLAAEA